MNQSKHEKLCKTYWDLMDRVRTDPEYACMLKELNELEPLYESVLGMLSRERRDLIDRYVTLRETMGRRMLECACEELLFGS